VNPTVVAAARSSLKAVAAVADRIVAPKAGITILIYHRVGHGAGGQMDLDPSVFADQLDHLAATSRVLSLDAAIAELAAPGPLQPGVVLTFDDGTDDWTAQVAPALAARGMPATFYVATAFVDDGAEFPLEGRPISWDGLRELRDSGIATIGSHTHTHQLLDRLPAAALADELDRSIDRLTEELQIPVEHFCYPKAVPPSPAADDAVRARFRSATLSGTRANTAGADPYLLARSPIQASDSARWFAAKVAGGLGLEDRLRARLNTVRYRNRTT